MGTPDFAVPTLRKIHESHHKVVGIVSQPDRPRGRGRKLQPTPIKRFALERNISPILQPLKMKDENFVEALRELEADIFVVVAFRILPEVVFTMPEYGTVNLHPSLLPRYRGAAPLNWAVINGDRESGITTIFIRKEIDAGNIIMQRAESIGEHETAGDIHNRYSEIGADMILESVNLIATGVVEVRPQDDSLATPAPKLTKEMCRLTFEQPATTFRNWVQGLSPFPGAYVFWDDRRLKLLRARVVEADEIKGQPGEILKASDGELLIACTAGVVAVDELQLEGRKSLKTKDFLAGISIPEGTVLQ